MNMLERPDIPAQAPSGASLDDLEQLVRFLADEHPACITDQTERTVVMQLIAALGVLPVPSHILFEMC